MAAEPAQFLQALQSPDSAIALLTDWNTLTAMLAGAFTVVSWLNQQAAARKAEEAEEQVRRLQFESVRASLDAQISGWGAEVINALSNAEQLVQSRALHATAEGFDAARRQSLGRISALVDQGRLFFANVLHDVVGQDRPAAFGGFRPAILDAVMLTHERLRRRPADSPPEAWAAEAGPMLEARRAFVSELQRAIDPRRRDEVFRTLTASARSRPRENNYAWDSVVALVDAFEAEHGAGSFWRERPKTAAELGLGAPAPRPKGIGRLLPSPKPARI